MAGEHDNANLNMFPLEKAENAILLAVNCLNQIEPLNDTQLELRNMCLEDLREFQGGNLLALRRATE